MYPFLLKGKLLSVGMKMGNNVRRIGIEPTSFALYASSLSITPSRLPDITTLSTPSCLCGSLPESSVQTISTTHIPLEL